MIDIEKKTKAYVSGHMDAKDGIMANPERWGAYSLDYLAGYETQLQRMANVWRAT